MAGHPVTGDQYRLVDQRMTEIKRQLNQEGGSPLDPTWVASELQRIIEGVREDTVAAAPRPIADPAKIIKLDCSKPFDPVVSIDPGWSIWKGSADGDGLTGDEDQDPRVLALSVIDLTKVKLQSGLIGQGSMVGGAEFVRRIRLRNAVPLGANAFQAFQENPHLYPESFKEKTNGHTTYVFFPGTVLRSPSGSRCGLCLYWHGGKLGWDCRWLGDWWDANDPAAVLA